MLEAKVVIVVRGKLALDMEQCDGLALAGQAVESVATIAATAGVPPNIASQPLSFWADPARLIQVLTNLLTNAIEFSSAGSPVVVSVRQGGDMAHFEVTDQGRGIASNEHGSIFGRFHQVDASDARPVGGWGLGLAISKAIVDKHGGRIWVESEIGHGSTFIFEVPIGPPAPA